MDDVFDIELPLHARKKQEIFLDKPYPYGDIILLKFLCVERTFYGEKWLQE